MAKRFATVLDEGGQLSGDVMTKWKRVTQKDDSAMAMTGCEDKLPEVLVFGQQETGIRPLAATPGDDRLRYSFASALGDRYPAADPLPYEWTLNYTPKIKLQNQRGVSGGGCG